MKPVSRWSVPVLGAAVLRAWETTKAQLHPTERQRLFVPVWLRPAIGGAATGAIAVGVMLLVGVGGVTGGGYDVLVGALSGKYAVDVLLVLGACKLVATVLSYSSGGAGGIFDAEPHAAFAPGEGAPRLLETIEAGTRQEVFPVLDVDRHLVGLITLEDLLTLSAEPDLGGLVCAADVMRPPAAVQRTDPVSRALELMMSMAVRELPVIDGERRVLGFVGEVAIAHEYVRARVVEHAELSASGTP